MSLPFPNTKPRFSFSLGGWRNGMKSGYGVETWSSGSSYQGDYMANQRHGRGTYKWADGQVYDGEWEFNNRCGRGLHSFSDGRRYAGQWKNGFIEGRGVFTWYVVCSVCCVHHCLVRACLTRQSAYIFCTLKARWFYI
jgi:hypothetical protein